MGSSSFATVDFLREVEQLPRLFQLRTNAGVPLTANGVGPGAEPLGLEILRDTSL